MGRQPVGNYWLALITTKVLFLLSVITEPHTSCFPTHPFSQALSPARGAVSIIHLQTFRTDYHRYTTPKRAPILHRKEKFLPPENPLRSKLLRCLRDKAVVTTRLTMSTPWHGDGL